MQDIGYSEYASVQEKHVEGVDRVVAGEDGVVEMNVEVQNEGTSVEGGTGVARGEGVVHVEQMDVVYEEENVDGGVEGRGANVEVGGECGGEEYIEGVRGRSLSREDDTRNKGVWKQ